MLTLSNPGIEAFYALHSLLPNDSNGMGSPHISKLQVYRLTKTVLKVAARCGRGNG